MLLEFENKVSDFSKKCGFFKTARRILLAVSGGADSIALLHVMYVLKQKKIFDAELFCAHINHRLRAAEADLDEAFSVEQAAKLNLPIRTKKVDVYEFARENKLSIETAGRGLRIEGLIEIARANNCDLIATAHQKNDNAETVLDRMFRGTGFRGLAGIWPMRVFAEEVAFIRPLLCATRNEIIEYLQMRNFTWREDHTNVDCSYKRNYIRHKLLPLLQQDFDGSIVEQLYRLSQSSQKFYSLIRSRAEMVLQEIANQTVDSVTLNLKGFLEEPEPVRIELVRQSLTAIGSGEGSLTQRHYKRIMRLSEKNISGRKIELPGEFGVLREYDNLIFIKPCRKAHFGKQVSEEANLEVPGRTRFGRYVIEAAIFEADEVRFEEFKAHKNSYTEWFDWSKVTSPLFIRYRKDGDFFWPLGLAGEKKVGKFITADKVPRQVREKILIISDFEKIIWVCPIRISDKTKITDKTNKVIQLKVTYI